MPRKTIAWYDADPSRKLIDDEANRCWDKIIAAYSEGLAAAQRLFPRA